MSEWKKGIFEDVCLEMFSGGTPSTSNPLYWNGNLSWLSSGETRKSFIYSTEKKITNAAVEDSSTRLALKDDVVLASAGQGKTRGQTSLLKIDTYINQSIIAIRPNDKMYFGFLYYYLKSKYNALRDVSDGNSIRGSITTKDLKSFPIIYPKYEEQVKIADFLFNYDKLMEHNNRRIEILEEMAQRLYREWFVHFRFHGHENVKMVESELGMMPEGWVVKSFSDLVFINPKHSKPKGNTFSYIEMAGLSNKNMLIFLSGKRDKFSGSKFRNGDTLVARITPCLENGKTGFVQCLKENEVGVGSTEFIVLRSDKLSPEMVYLIARQSDFRGILIKSMFGASGRQRANVDVLKEYYIPFPPSEIISAFQKRVQPLFKKIEILNKKNINLQKTRDLLLPRLISGDIDVSRIDIPISEVDS